MAAVSQVICGLVKKPIYLVGCTSRWYAAQSGTPSKPSGPSPTPPSAASNLGDVPGLSSAILKTTSGEVGPGASKSGSYKNPEYFSYNRMSYHEAEIEMKNFRNPQPSNKVPLKTG